MEIREISNVYTALPQCGAFLKAISDESVRHVFLSGLLASSASVFFSAVAERVNGKKNAKPKTQNCDAPSQQFKTQNSKLKTQLKRRNSNFELLRIIAMFSIVLAHTPSQSYCLGYGLESNMSAQIFHDMVSGWTGSLGNCLFIMISSWFL